ncbi:MAG: hypothetical protein KatS3mg111_0835 [Pirellulaceae bacterium]|nr:MAG: hypothetical protein KatS3mg111_0835 [Pirellulaceae bacterium]
MRVRASSSKLAVLSSLLSASLAGYAVCGEERGVIRQPRLQAQAAAHDAGSAVEQLSPHAAGESVELRWAARSTITASTEQRLDGGASAHGGEPDNDSPVRMIPALESSVPAQVVGDDAHVAATQPGDVPIQSAASPATADRTSRQSRGGQATLAASVSHRILNSAAAPNIAESALDPLEPAPGWRAVGEELARRYQRCSQLLHRGAHLSALDEAHQGVLFLCRVIDATVNKRVSEPAWLAAQTALDEADSFTAEQTLAYDEQFLRRLVLSHSTPVLKGVELRELSPLTAAQYYRHYASEQLHVAAMQHPWAAELYVAIGHCYQARAEADEVSSTRWWYRALVFYQAAHQLTPTNSLIANQHAYALLRLDRPHEAQQILLPFAMQPAADRAVLQNTIEASRRVGDNAKVNWAMAKLAQLPPPGASPTAPPVMEIPPQMFVQLSPYEASPYRRAAANANPPQASVR